MLQNGHSKNKWQYTAKYNSTDAPRTSAASYVTFAEGRL